MAEGFARRYGSDVMEPVSAGFAPAPIVQPLTLKVMAEKNINIEEQYPKDLGQIELEAVDIIVNISGRPLPADLPMEVRTWTVQDPIGLSEEVYLEVRDQIEHLVMSLILDLRRPSRPQKRAPSLRQLLRMNDRVSG
jgi:arsenate reductase (thioredoxin)